jgi:hypothetical protein
MWREKRIANAKYFPGRGNANARQRSRFFEADREEKLHNQYKLWYIGEFCRYPRCSHGWEVVELYRGARQGRGRNRRINASCSRADMTDIVVDSRKDFGAVAWV